MHLGQRNMIHQPKFAKFKGFSLEGFLEATFESSDGAEVVRICPKISKAQKIADSPMVLLDFVSRLKLTYCPYLTNRKNSRIP